MFFVQINQIKLSESGLINLQKGLADLGGIFTDYLLRVIKQAILFISEFILRIRMVHAGIVSLKYEN